MAKNKFIGGAICIAMGTVIVKLIGAIYRIPLVNLIGAKGLGLYQMIFPVYALLIDFSGASMPSALSKIISSVSDGERKAYAKAYLKVSLRHLKKVGLVGSLLLVITAYPVSLLQGNTDAFLGYLTLAPSVFLVSIISCYRGYFQGLMIMKHTAVSQIIESLFKLAFGLVIAYLLMPNVRLAVAGATLSVTLSEVIALIYLLIKYKRQTKNDIAVEIKTDKGMIKGLIKTALPITLTGVMIPFSHFLESFIVLNALPFTQEISTALYGVLSGVVHTVLSLPVGLTYGVAVASIPTVSSLKTLEEKRRGISDGVLLTAGLGVVFSVFVYIFAPQIVNILFSKLSLEQIEISVRLLRLTSPTVLLLSLVQTTNAQLVATDKFYLPLFSLGTGIAVKIILSLILIPSPKINIYGGGISLIACYFVAVMINFIILIKKGTQDASKTISGRKIRAI